MAVVIVTGAFGGLIRPWMRIQAGASGLSGQALQPPSNCAVSAAKQLKAAGNWRPASSSLKARWAKPQEGMDSPIAGDDGDSSTNPLGRWSFLNRRQTY